MSWRRVVAACAGPALIAAFVLFALRGFAFGSRLTNEHPDLLAFWLPRWAFLGRSLAAWHVPVWNPYEMLGYRFAADPQSGWLYAPPMVLFSMLGPGTAIRMMILLNPLLAGLGLYGFLRIEGLSRPVTTAAGLSMAAMMATSEIAISLPFAGFLAWTTVTLMGAAGYVRATRWSGRLAWLALAGFGWSQVASAHLAHGLVMCSLLVVGFLVAKSVSAVREGSHTPWKAALLVVLPLLVLPAASLAVLVPRFDLIATSSLGSGYGSLGEGIAQVAKVGRSPLQTNGVWAGWPLALGASPGAYAGAAILLAIPLALRARRWRALVWAFGLVFVVCYDLMLDAVVTGRTGDLIARLPYGDTVLHNPGRLRYIIVLVAPVLGAIGIQGLRDDPLPLHRILPWLAGGAALWVGLPLLAGGDPSHWRLLALAMVPAVVALVALSRSRRWAPALLVTVLGFEVVASAVLAGHYTGDTLLLGLEGGRFPNVVPQPLRAPDVDLTSFLRRTELVDRIDGNRYLTWAPPAAAYEKGYLFAQEPIDWPALTMERGTLFAIRDVLGYNPVQLARYWTWIRAANRLPLFYNASSIQLPTRRDVDLMGVRYLVVPQGVSSPVRGRVVGSADGYDLVEVNDPPPMASVVPDWNTVDDAAHAFLAIGFPGFDPSRLVTVEGRPGLQREQAAAAGTAAYDETSATDVRITVEAKAPSIVLIRNSYDDGWSATVDGQTAPLLPADGFLQGVPVSKGDHEVLVTYRDGAVTLGLRLSALVWLMLAALIGVSAVVDRRRSGRDSVVSPAMSRLRAAEARPR
jgi:hypothetical protein